MIELLVIVNLDLALGLVGDTQWLLMSACYDESLSKLHTYNRSHRKKTQSSALWHASIYFILYLQAKKSVSMQLVFVPGPVPGQSPPVSMEVVVLANHSMPWNAGYRHFHGDVRLGKLFRNTFDNFK